jgi:Na+/proline symporter
MAGAILTGLAGIPLLDPPLVGAEREKVFIQLVDLLFNPWIARGFVGARVKLDGVQREGWSAKERE